MDAGWDPRLRQAPGAALYRAHILEFTGVPMRSRHAISQPDELRHAE